MRLPEGIIYIIYTVPLCPCISNQGLNNENVLGGNRVILDQLQGHSRGLVWALESCVRGSLTIAFLPY